MVCGDGAAGAGAGAGAAAEAVVEVVVSYCIITIIIIIKDSIVARAQSRLSLFWSFGCRPARSRTTPISRLRPLRFALDI